MFRTAAAGGGGYSGKDGTGDGECIDNVPIPAWAERAAEPYASWQPCDTVATYTEVCDPQPPTCHVEYECETAQVRQGDSRTDSRTGSRTNSRTDRTECSWWWWWWWWFVVGGSMAFVPAVCVVAALVLVCDLHRKLFF